MLTGPNHLAVLYVLCDGTQEELLHNLPWHWGQTDRPKVPWIFIPALLVHQHAICYPPVNEDIPDYTGLLTNGGKCLGEHFHQLCQYPSGLIHLCVSKWCSRSLTISTWIIGASFFSSSLSSSSGGWVPGEQLVLLLKTESKKALSPPFPNPLSLCFPLHPIKTGDGLQPSFCCKYIDRNILYCLLW